MSLSDDCLARLPHLHCQTHEDEFRSESQTSRSSIQADIIHTVLKSFYRFVPLAEPLFFVEKESSER